MIKQRLHVESLRCHSKPIEKRREIIGHKYKKNIDPISTQEFAKACTTADEERLPTTIVTTTWLGRVVGWMFLTTSSFCARWLRQYNIYGEYIFLTFVQLVIYLARYLARTTCWIFCSSVEVELVHHRAT